MQIKVWLFYWGESPGKTSKLWPVCGSGTVVNLQYNTMSHLLYNPVAPGVDDRSCSEWILFFQCLWGLQCHYDIIINGCRDFAERFKQLSLLLICVWSHSVNDRSRVSVLWCIYKDCLCIQRPMMRRRHRYTHRCFTTLLGIAYSPHYNTFALLTFQDWQQ